ncbi:MAG TPA: isochorismatase family protein [Candidatus Binataceae bacterium]|nr:isochorismatase family protein [Candidatus Binataceae bacterium]
MAEDKGAIYQRSGLGHRIGYGKHPALLVIDMQLGFTAPERSPLAGNLDSQIAAINRLIRMARKGGTPVVFTVVAYDPKIPGDGGLWPEKAPTLLELKIGSELAELDPRLRRKPEDLLLTKKYASAFLGTPLSSTLISRGVDTVLVTGCTTSGCVRATVVDALSYGFRPIIPEEAVGDRAQEPHEASLFDIDSKYGDVVRLVDALAYLEETK